MANKAFFRKGSAATSSGGNPNLQIDPITGDINVVDDSGNVIGQIDLRNDSTDVFNNNLPNV